MVYWFPPRGPARRCQRCVAAADAACEADQPQSHAVNGENGIPAATLAGGNRLTSLHRDSVSRRNLLPRAETGPTLASLAIVDPNAIWAAECQRHGRTLEITRPRRRYPVSSHRYDVPPDGQRFLVENRFRSSCASSHEVQRSANGIAIRRLSAISPPHSAQVP